MKSRTTIRMRKRLCLITTGTALCVILAAGVAQAHHAFAAEYDARKPVTLRGTVSRVEWINPHSWIHIDVKKNDGSVERWMIEAAGPAALQSRGLTRDLVKVGTDVTVNGYQSKDGSLRVNARDVALPNGPPMFIGSAGVGAPYDDASLPQDEKRVARIQVSPAWWMNTALMQRLGITDDQRAKIERAFENHRQAILSTTDQLEKEEAQLARLLDAESVDQNAVLTQIDRVTQARSEMERAGALMTLEMRTYLTRAQWAQLPGANVSVAVPGLGLRMPRPVAPPIPGKRGNQ
jgi:cell division FtsZ-interacting protein ZapD